MLKDPNDQQWFTFATQLFWLRMIHILDDPHQELLALGKERYSLFVANQAFQNMVDAFSWCLRLRSQFLSV